MQRGWKLLKSSDIFDSYTDKSHGGKLQVLSATQDRGIVPRSEMDIDIKFDEKSLPTYKQVVSGDFVIHLRSFQGGLAYSNVEGIISPAYTILKPKLEICDDYYKYLFQSRDYIKRLNSATYGIRDGKQISYATFGEIKIPMPPLVEQKTIAEVLTAQDVLIATKGRLIAEKQKQKRWLMQNLLHNRGWNTARFEHMFDRLVRKNLIEQNKNVLTISAQHGLVNQKDFFNKSVASENLSGYYLLYKGDFAYNKSYSKNYAYGAIKRLEKYDVGVVSPLYICFKPSSKNKCPEFYCHYFESALLGREIKAFAQEGARNHGLLNLSVGDFFTMKIPVPPLDEQNTIAKILTTADREIHLLTKELDQQRLIKKYLMQQLLTGKIRIKGAE